MNVATSVTQSHFGTRPRVTLETLLYVGLLVMGGAIRFGGLGGAPLLPMELETAYPAWLHATGQAQGAPADIGAPLLYAGQVLLFWLAGGSDAWARVLSATVGTLLVGLPWLLRVRFGRTMTLFLIFLIAVDPWLIFFSRTADGVIFSLFFGLLAMVALDRARHAAVADGRPWLQLAAVATGLLLVSGPTAWSLLPILGLYLVAFGLPPGLTAAHRTPGDLTMLALLGGSAALLGATIWFAYPQGLAHVATSLGRWLGAVNPLGVVEYSMAWVGLRLLAEAALVIVFGLVGLALLWRRRRESVRTDLYFLIVWLLWGLLLLLLPGRGPATLTIGLLPLIIAAAYGLSRWIGRVPSGLTSTEFWIALSVVSAFLFSVFLWARILIVLSSFEMNTALIIVLLLLAAAIVLLSYGLWTDWTRAAWLLGLVLFGSLLIGSARSAWRLNYQHVPTRPDGFYRVATHPDIRNLAADLATLSAVRTGDPGELPLQIQEDAADDLLLGWYLRDMRRRAWVLSPGDGVAGAVSPAYVTHADGATPAGDTYLGSDYAVSVAWLPDTLLAAPGVQTDEIGPDGAALERLDRQWRDAIRPLLRWILYREIAHGIQRDSVTLWVDGGE